MGMKEIATMLVGAAAMMPEVSIQSRKKPAVVRYGFTAKKWEQRKRKLKQQKISRKINRQKAL